MSQNLWSDEPKEPIKHLRVLDLSVMLTGPYLTRILAQHGAQVIKVEKGPTGDPCRDEKYTALFELLNQGKKSLCVDFAKPEGKELIKLLATEVDVVVENFREGVMDQLGVGYADLAAINPDLIYLSLRGMADKNASKSGHDLNFIATSGCGEWFIEGGVNYSTLFADVLGGVFVPITKLLMHLSNPNRRGMHLICHADEGFRSFYLPKAYESIRRENCPVAEKNKFEGLEKLNGNFPNSRFYRCRDNQWISLQAIQKKHWVRFCQSIDKQSWTERSEDLNLVPEIEKMFSEAPAHYWETLSHHGESCLFKVIPWKEFLEQTQTKTQLNSDPLHWIGFAPNQSLERAPSLGQDSFGICSEVGYKNEKIAQLLASGTISQAS